MLDLVIPDLVPFADEILLALGTLLLGSLRRRRGGAAQPRRRCASADALRPGTRSDPGHLLI